jgi:hypothetical protein
MRSRIVLSLLALVASCATTSGRTDSSTPADGRALLARMHDRYTKHWFQTLTFVQRTTQRKADGTSQVSTWYESLRGTRLRIDVSDPTAGNGALYTPDSLYVVRAGKVVRTRAEGNPFLPLIMGVYIQPLELTVAQLAPLKVDLSRIRLQDWEGTPTYVVGSASPSDTTSPQFWVEKDRLIVTRFLLPLFPTPDHRVQDVRLENNVAVGDGWLATRVRMLDQGNALQTEEYSDWRANVPLPETFFQVEHWSEGKHWAASVR